MFFFDFFLNHFPKPTEVFSVINNRSIVFLRRLWRQSMRKKKSAEVPLIHAEQMPLYNFVILREKRDSNTDVFLWNSWNFQERWRLSLKTLNIFYYVIKNYVGHKSAIFNAVPLLYCIYCYLDDETWDSSMMWHNFVTLRGTTRQQKRVLESKKGIAHAV